MRESVQRVIVPLDWHPSQFSSQHSLHTGPDCRWKLIHCYVSCGLLFVVVTVGNCPRVQLDWHTGKEDRDSTVMPEAGWYLV